MKHQKQIDFRVFGSGQFDEGADKSWGLFWLKSHECIISQTLMSSLAFDILKHSS
ncbi:hypothetical protein Bca4012_037286 [Brassica carinata]